MDFSNVLSEKALGTRLGYGRGRWVVSQNLVSLKVGFLIRRLELSDVSCNNKEVSGTEKKLFLGTKLKRRSSS